MPAICPKPGCGEVLSENQTPNACPKCGSNISAQSPLPWGHTSAGFLPKLERLAGDDTRKVLFLAGLGSLALLAVTALLPWFSLFNIRVLGIQTGAGALQLLLSLGAGGFFAVAIVKNDAKLFDIALWSAAGWSVLAALWRLLNVLQMVGLGVTGFGLYVALIAALGAAGTLGYVAVRRIGEMGSRV